jgi:hypothetical protein
MDFIGQVLIVFRIFSEPFGYRALQKGNTGIGNAGKTVYPSVGDLLVAFHASTPFLHLPVHDYRCFQPGIYQKLFMTPDTIVLNHFCTRLQNPDHLSLLPKGEQGGVSQPVVGLEVVFIENIVVGYVAIVAMRFFAVRTVVPGRILGSHNMAVNTRFRPVRKIGMSLAEVKRKQPQSCKYPRCYDDGNPPPGWWK